MKIDCDSLEHDGKVYSSLQVDDPIDVALRPITHPDCKWSEALVEGNDRDIVRGVVSRVAPVQVEVIGTLG